MKAGNEKGTQSKYLRVQMEAGEQQLPRVPMPAMEDSSFVNSIKWLIKIETLNKDDPALNHFNDRSGSGSDAMLACTIREICRNLVECPNLRRLEVFESAERLILSCIPGRRNGTQQSAVSSSTLEKYGSTCQTRRSKRRACRRFRADLLEGIIRESATYLDFLFHVRVGTPTIVASLNLLKLERSINNSV